MRLKDLLLRAGGVLPGVRNEITISKALFFDEAKLITVKLDLLEKGDESQNVLLDDEDIVMVRTYSDFFEKPMWVEIKGEVKYPGKLSDQDQELPSERPHQRGGRINKRGKRERHGVCAEVLSVVKYTFTTAAGVVIFLALIP